MKEQTRFNRNFTLLILGQASSLVGNFGLKFALSMYVLERTGSAGAFSALLAASVLPTILLSPLGGILADRADRRAVMVTLDALSGGAVLAAWLLLPLGRELWVAGGLMVGLAVLAAFESPTVQACIPQLLPAEKLMQGNALVGQVQAVAGLLTPFLGSVAYAALGLGPVLAGAAACFWLTAGLECCIRLERRAKPAPPQGGQGVWAVVREDLAAGLHFLRREQPALLKLMLLAALASLFVAGAVVVGFPYLVRSVLGLSAAHYGAAESAMGAAAILGSVFVALAAQRLRLRSLAAQLAGVGGCLLAAGAAFWLPVGALGRYWVLLAAFCGCQFLCSVFSTCALTALQQRTPEAMMGKVLSYLFTITMCAQPVGQLLYGALFDRFAAAPGWVLLPSGLAAAAVGAASVGFFRRMEQGE